MNKKFILLNIVYMIFLFGCGSKSTPVYDAPTAFFYTYTLEENNDFLSGIVNSDEFSSQNSIDLSGKIDLNFSVIPKKKYIQLNVSNGYIYNSILEGGLNYNDSHKIVFFNSKPFIFDNRILSISSFKSALSSISTDINVCISELETIKTVGNEVEKKLSQNLIDLINIVHDYDNKVNSISYSDYIIKENFLDDNLNPFEYYNGILFIIHSVFHDKSYENLLISKRILENIRADETNFIDNNSILFNVHSDDLKSIYMLNCLLVGSSDYLKLRDFKNESNSLLGQRLILLLEEVGYF